MNTGDLYIDRQDLMTFEELEEFNHEDYLDEIPTYTDNMHNWLFTNFEDFPCPDEFGKEDFMMRTPAMGATTELLEEIRNHNKRLSPVQQRLLRKTLKRKMLRQLISCSGTTTTDELLDILQAELQKGTPAPIPDWYEFRSARYGPRKIGYDQCGARGCCLTETWKKKFARCGKCKLIFYCSKECQTADWKCRHKKVCKDGSKKRHDVKKASARLNNFIAQFER